MNQASKLQEERLEDQLREVPSFGHFEPDNLRLLAESCRLCRLESGEAAFAAGDPTSSFFVVLDGKVTVRRAVAGQEVNFWRLQAGELLGNTGFLSGEVHAFTAVADGEVTLAAIDRDQVLPVAQADLGFERDLFLAFWHSTSLDLRLANRRLAGFFSKQEQRPREARPAAARGSELELDLDSRRAVFLDRGLPAGEAESLASVARARRYSPGQLIFAEGDLGSEIFVVQQGEVAICRYLPGSGDEALAFLGPGELFGEMVLIGDHYRSADAKARGDGAVILGISRHEIGRFLADREQPPIGLIKLLSAIAATRLSEMADKIADWYALAGGDYF